jgi:parvulin-like peptidyl-prolyl isomerase
MRLPAIIFVCVSAAAAFGQAPPAQPAGAAEPDPGTVIATFQDGKKLTYGELKLFVSALANPQMQQAAMRDRKAFVSQIGLMRKLAQMAEESKLHEQSPAKELLDFRRMEILMNAQLNDAYGRITVPAADVKAFYDANRDRFSQVQVKALYVSFVSGAAAGPGKHVTEAEARIKIEALLKQIRAGADFVQMVRKHSEDKTSAEKDGDFGNLRRSDNLPDAVRTAIFALKAGEVSEPVRQPNGFYLFRAEKITEQPFDQVRDEVFSELREKRFGEWMAQTQRSVEVKLADDTPPPAVSPVAPAPPK